MEPIRTIEGEEAARRAASDFQVGADFDIDLEDERDDHSVDINDRAYKLIELILEALLLPFFLLYDLFVVVIGEQLFHWAEACLVFAKRQANAFLNGMSPYNCSITITAVNIVVLCSIWYMFIDQARLAFFPTSADNALAKVNFVIWSILTLELTFEVFIRPDDYNTLIQSDKAFMPRTARYISGLHLAVEAISLTFFVPEFLCLFKSDLRCDERGTFSLSYATLLALSGPTRAKSFAGRAFYACIRLRVFGLVRLWRNMWLSRKFIKRERQTHRIYQDWDRVVIPNDVGNEDEEETESNLEQNRIRMEQKQRNDALINASNIGTALMVTNSYRTLAILVTIMGVFPMISLIAFSAVVNTATTDMVGQLQATNVLVTVENQTNCEFLVDSVESWARSWSPSDHSLMTSDTENFLLGVIVNPARCQEQFEALDVGALRFVQKSCSTVQAQYQIDFDDDPYGKCIVGALEVTDGADLRSIADNFDLRGGNLLVEHSSRAKKTLVLEDGSSVGTQFQISACFNQTYAVESS
jgi:hypothetical protein